MGFTVRMTTQVSLRLDDRLVSRIDAMIRAGEISSRAEIVESALERELRRRLYALEVERMRAAHDDPELDEWVESAFATLILDD